ncbi:hypothetical protein E4V51_07995 [Paenibacillus sp. 28ISP30-2]|nr:hypothetical protein [Paenibacillus sp. 23TSA30-6]MBE0341171.1 hypothetical protein [Paenibacillus sp. 28ISP30-2]
MEYKQNSAVSELFGDRALFVIDMDLYKEDYIDMFIRDFTEQFGDVNILFKKNSDSAIQSAILEGLAISIGEARFGNTENRY